MKKIKPWDYCIPPLGKNQTYDEDYPFVALNSRLQCLG